MRLFEAAAVGAAIISDRWPGLETVFEPGREILCQTSAADAVRYLHTLSDSERHAIGAAANQRVSRRHTWAHRLTELWTILARGR